jgi:hypothetical protein
LTYCPWLAAVVHPHSDCTWALAAASAALSDGLLHLGLGAAPADPASVTRRRKVPRLVPSARVVDVIGYPLRLRAVDDPCGPGFLEVAAGGSHTVV